MLFLQNARERLSLITLEDTEYFNVLEDAAVTGISGGSIYDAAIARCALKAKAQQLYTWNIKHFVRLGENVAALVRQP